MSRENLGSPLSSGILIKCYTDSGQLKSGLLDLKKQGKLVPCVEIVKTGPSVVQVKEGQWGLLNDTVKPSVIVIHGEMFHLIKEYDLLYVYDHKPSMDEIYMTNTSIKVDLTPYVDVTPFVDMKAKFRNENNELVTLKGDKIAE